MGPISLRRRFVHTLLMTAALAAPRLAFGDTDLAQWTPEPAEWKGAKIAGDACTLTADKWSFLRSPTEFAHAELSAAVTISEPAKTFRFFGDGWSAWPDPTFGDGGFEAALLVRAGKDSGYRVQLSHKYQALVLTKYPEGGHVRVVPCAVKLKEPHRLVVRAQGSEIVASIDGQEKIRYHDTFLPLTSGQVGIGVSSGAKVAFDKIGVTTLAMPTSRSGTPRAHTPAFSVRKWLGDRQWVFDGDEPILQLHYLKDPSCFAKLKPGYKPQLTFDSHWGIENQGAFPEGLNKWTEPTVSGGGASVKATWSARNVKDRFTTNSTLVVGFDPQRGVYTYDIDSTLDVLPGEPFQFRYGFDFEHHTPLDPFRWQYLIARRRGGEAYHRPVYPIDPGPQYDLEPYQGARVWYGRHNQEMHIAPAVEYAIDPDWNRDPKDPVKLLERKLNTAVCAAFYDTGVTFAAENAVAGTKLRVKYRYTGYPAREAEELFKQSKIYDALTLDPNHHYIFADEWPKLTFSKVEPMSKSWIYGRTPFMTAHNTRPTYELEKNCGAGSGFAMKLGPASFAKANWPMPTPLAKGRYVLSAQTKAINVHGPGAYIEIEALQAKTNTKLAAARHYLGNGDFNWKRQGFVFDVPDEAAKVTLALGNAGTGETLVTDVELTKLDSDTIPAGIASQPNDRPAPDKSPAGAIADYRMQEGKGFHVLNYAGGEHLHLANLDWVVVDGRPALRFANNETGRKEYRRDSGLARHYLSQPAYAGKDTLPIALSGHHGGGARMNGLTLAAWVKPAAEMAKGNRGDVIGYGGRRFVLSLDGQKAPYRLTARVNVNDTILSATKLEADRWYHVAMSAEPADGQWRVRLYVDGKQVGEGMTQKFASDSLVVPSLILGAEIFYFHDAYYRGLIGRTLVFERALTAEQIAELAK